MVPLPQKLTGSAPDMGDKIFQGGPEYLFRGSKYFSQIEINYPEGPNISIFLD